MREVETYGGRVGGVWERWRCVGEVEVCERGGVCGRGGGVWERWCVREVEVCERGGGV